MGKNLSISKLEIHVDNLACVQFLNTREAGSGDNARELNYCRMLLDDDSWETKIFHVYREGNRVADWLTIHIVYQESRLIIIDNIPIELSRILEEDIRGVALPRLGPP